MNGGASIFRNLTQNIPPPAPAGDYTFRAVCGNHPGLVFADDSFPFSKSGVLSAGNGYNNWLVDGWENRSSAKNYLPLTCELKQNYPNPFNPETNLEFTLAEDGNTTLSVYNLAGEEVALLIDGHLQAGRHSLAWNAEDLPSGIYFCRLQSAGFSEVRKMILLK